MADAYTEREMDHIERRFNDLMTDVFDGLREFHPDVVNDDERREPLVDAARAAYERRIAGQDDFGTQSDYEVLRDVVETAIDRLEAVPVL